jgi:glycosyltransferase involved in cell wall biosynthesis
MPFKSALNPIALIRNMFYAYKNQGVVNHITGDIYYISLTLEGSKTIITVHDLESLDSLNWVKQYLLFLFWLKLPVLKVKYVTVISEHTKRKLLKATGISEEKVVVIPNCFTFKQEDFKPKAELMGDRPVLLQIGTKPNKNLENLVLAVEGLTCKLLIIGKLSEVQQQLLEVKRIDYENYWQLTDDEVKALYYRSDIVTFVSKYEGFGLPILEANAYGRPVITANVTAMPEVAGNSALLVDPYDPGQIRDAFKRLINDAELRSNLVMRGYENVQRFKPEFVATQYETLYKRVISENVKH